MHTTHRLRRRDILQRVGASVGILGFRPAGRVFAGRAGCFNGRTGRGAETNDGTASRRIGADAGGPPRAETGLRDLIWEEVPLPPAPSIADVRLRTVPQVTAEVQPSARRMADPGESYVA